MWLLRGKFENVLKEICVIFEGYMRVLSETKIPKILKVE